MVPAQTPARARSRPMQIANACDCSRVKNAVHRFIPESRILEGKRRYATFTLPCVTLRVNSTPISLRALRSPDRRRILFTRRHSRGKTTKRKRKEGREGERETVNYAIRSSERATGLENGRRRRRRRCPPGSCCWPSFLPSTIDTTFASDTLAKQILPDVRSGRAGPKREEEETNGFRIKGTRLNITPRPISVDVLAREAWPGLTTDCFRALLQRESPSTLPEDNEFTNERTVTSHDPFFHASLKCVFIHAASWLWYMYREV